MDVNRNSKKKITAEKTSSKDGGCKIYETRSRTNHTTKLSDKSRKESKRRDKTDERSESKIKNAHKEDENKPRGGTELKVKNVRKEKDKEKKTEPKIRDEESKTGSKSKEDPKRQNKTELKIRDQSNKREDKKKLSKTESKIKRREKSSPRGSKREKEDDQWYRKRPQLRQTTLLEIVEKNKRMKQNHKKNDENHNPLKRKLTAEEEEVLFKKRLEEADYKKYGKKTPSFDEIVKYSRELETYKNDVNTACEFVSLNRIQTISTSKHRKSKIELLECKHLSLEEIDERFRELKAFCKNIIEGLSSSKRHEQYKKLWPHCSSLTYNTSMATFTSDQIQCLVKLCERKFKSCTTEYFFMVLLPELCLKIFCDLHRMSPEEGEDYLQKRPVKDII